MSSAKSEPAASRLPPAPAPPPRGGGGAVVAAGAEFDAAADEAEVEPVDEAAVAALLAEIAQARARPFAIGDGAIDDTLGHEGGAHTILWVRHCGRAAQRRAPESMITAAVRIPDVRPSFETRPSGAPQDEGASWWRD
jgi:hypothetical protein